LEEHTKFLMEEQSKVGVEPSFQPEYYKKALEEGTYWQDEDVNKCMKNIQEFEKICSEALERQGQEHLNQIRQEVHLEEEELKEYYLQRAESLRTTRESAEVNFEDRLANVKDHLQRERILEERDSILQKLNAEEEQLSLEHERQSAITAQKNDQKIKAVHLANGYYGSLASCNNPFTTPEAYVTYKKQRESLIMNDHDQAANMSKNWKS